MREEQKQTGKVDAPERGKCFIVAPIGEPTSSTRRRSDLVLQHIIVPAAVAEGYAEENIVRADRIPNPGIITSQIIQHLVEDELVIADLTDHNPNVFYELAIRHATRKPVVILIQFGQRLPFDVIQNRAIFFDLADWDSPRACQIELQNQIRSVLANPEGADNPISAAMRFKALSESGEPKDQILADLVRSVHEIQSFLSEHVSERKRTVDNTELIHLVAGLGTLQDFVVSRFGRDVMRDAVKKVQPASGDLKA